MENKRVTPQLVVNYMFHYFNIPFVSPSYPLCVTALSSGNHSARDTQGMRKG